MAERKLPVPTGVSFEMHFDNAVRHMTLSELICYLEHDPQALMHLRLSSISEQLCDKHERLLAEDIEGYTESLRILSELTCLKSKMLAGRGEEEDLFANSESLASLLADMVCKVRAEETAEPEAAPEEAPTQLSLLAEAFYRFLRTTTKEDPR